MILINTIFQNQTLCSRYLSSLTIMLSIISLFHMKFFHKMCHFTAVCGHVGRITFFFLFSIWGAAGFVLCCCCLSGFSAMYLTLWCCPCDYWNDFPLYSWNWICVQLVDSVLATEWFINLSFKKLIWKISQWDHWYCYLSVTSFPLSKYT